MTEFTVPDMTCGHCEASIRKALSTLPDLEEIAVDRPARRASVCCPALVEPFARR